MILKEGDRVEVNWGRRGWLPGIVEGYAASEDPDENFRRIRVKMDNGFGCDGSGYHPNCVRPLCLVETVAGETMPRCSAYPKCMCGGPEGWPDESQPQSPGVEHGKG